AASISTRRAWLLPVLVMAPWRRLLQLEYSEGTTPRNPISSHGRAKRAKSPISATSVTAFAVVALGRSVCGSGHLGAPPPILGADLFPSTIPVTPDNHFWCGSGILSNSARTDNCYRNSPGRYRS